MQPADTNTQKQLEKALTDLLHLEHQLGSLEGRVAAYREAMTRIPQDLAWSRELQVNMDVELKNVEEWEKQRDRHLVRLKQLLGLP